MEFGCGCFQKMLGSRNCDLSVGMDDFLGNSEIQRRGPEQAQHHLCIAVLHMWDYCMPLWLPLEPCRLCL